MMVTASYPEIIGHSVRVITVKGKTNQRREGVSSQYLKKDTILSSHTTSTLLLAFGGPPGISNAVAGIV